MAKYLCKNCQKWIELDWWEAHHGRCKSPASWGWLIFWLILIIGAANLAYGEENKEEKGDVKGCMTTFNGNTGKFLFEPFLKVADKDSPDENGQPEIWGFRPWNLEPPDKDGKTHPVNIRDSRFIPMGTSKEVEAGSTKRMIRCPDGLWR